MNLNLHHRNVKMNLVFASLIAQKLYQLEDALGITDASVTLERDEASPSELRILVELKAGDARLVAEGCDPESGTALLKLLQSLQAKTRASSHTARLPSGSSRKQEAVHPRSVSQRLSWKTR